LIDGVAKLILDVKGDEALYSLMSVHVDAETLFSVEWTLDKLQSGLKHPQLRKLRSFVDIDKCYQRTSYMKVSPDMNQIRNDSSFLESIRLNKFVTQTGKWYYEVEPNTTGCQMIGWVTDLHTFRPEERSGVGDDEKSWAYETFSNLKWHDNLPSIYSQKLLHNFSLGDVVGCALDLDAGKISFYIKANNTGVTINMGTAFNSLDRTKQYFPAVSLTSEQQCRLNFGTSPFKLLPPRGYQAYILANLDETDPKTVPANCEAKETSSV